MNDANGDDLGPPGSAPLTREVYERLRRGIIRGELRPNEVLTEHDIAGRFNVSRTPVRESLHRLAADGLIVSNRRHWTVREFSVNEIRELYEVRAALESYAARLAAQRATPEQIRALTDCRVQATATDLEGQDRVDVNEHLHELVVASANSQRLATLIGRNRVYEFNYRVALLYGKADFVISSREHGELIDAIAGRQSELAAQIAREHAEHALEVIAQRLVG